MSHLSDLLLNQYLDLALNPDELRRVELHLNGCPICSTRLEELHSLYSVLKAYQEESLPRDLTPFILRRMPGQRSQTAFRLLLVAQAGISVGLVVLLVTTFDQSRSFPNLIARFLSGWPVFILPATPMSWPTWSATIQGLTELTDRFLSMPGSLAQLNQIMNLENLIPIQGLNLLLIGLVVSVLWILGNTALLARHTEVRK